MSRLHYKLLADLLMMLHLTWIGVLLSGTIYIFYNAAYIKYHLIIVSGTLIFNLFLGGCPLTWWEEKARKSWNPNSHYYHNSFFATYAHKFFSKDISPIKVRLLQIWAFISIYVISLLLLTIK